MRRNLEGRELQGIRDKGKQVRDDIHSGDVASSCTSFTNSPALARSITSVAEKEIRAQLWKRFPWPRPLEGTSKSGPTWIRTGSANHICYYSDLRKMQEHYPAWGITKSLQNIFEEITSSWQERLSKDKLVHA